MLSDELIIQIALVWRCRESALHFEHVMLVQTETAVRFSLVTHGQDSPKGLRDVRSAELTPANLSKQTA